MELIIGTKRIIPEAISRIAGGVEAILKGDALMSLLDATFHGLGTIEISGGDLDRRPMDVASIRMQGADTMVTLVCTGPAARLM